MRGLLFALAHIVGVSKSTVAAMTPVAEESEGIFLVGRRVPRRRGMQDGIPWE